jgi:hypothetical protein
MKMKTLALATFSLLSTAIFAQCNPLSGEYKVGKSGADYSTLTEAIEALKCGGVSSPVTLLLSADIYTDKVELSDIKGLSFNNTLTIESYSGSNSDVVISASSADQTSTVSLNNLSNVTFQNLSLENIAGLTGNVLKLDGNCSNVRFKNVILDGIEKQTTGANSAVVYSTSNGEKSDIVFEGCELNNGSIGIFKGGNDKRTSVTGTLFFNQYESGLALSNESAPVISNNVVSPVSNYKSYKAISLDKISDNLIVSNNVVNAVNGSYGLALNNCEGKIESYGNVTNNSLNVGGQGTMYGLYITGSTDNQIFNFNRVKLTPTEKNSANQGYFFNTGSGKNINLMNNIFFDLNTGGYTILGNTYKDFFNQLPSQSNRSLSVSANGIMIEKVMPAN